MGFGLFAIFSVLRYRTNTMSTREMTYLFIVIALPVMNSTLMRSAQWDVLLAANVTVTLVLFVLEQEWGFHYESSQRVKYERVDLIKPEQRDLLLDDLRRRTGLPVKRVQMGRLNYLKDILTFLPKKQVQSIAFSSPALANGVTYDVYYGGSSTGTAHDGLYEGGAHSGGSKLISFTVSSIVTMIGSRSRF